MSESNFVIGTPVSCRDGACGVLARVVINPVAQALTHLVVEPTHGHSFGHLVPVDLVQSADAAIHLSCSGAEFAALEEAEETQFLQGAQGQWGYGQGQMLSFPFFGLGGMGGMGGLGGMGGIGGLGGMGGVGIGGMGGLGTGGLGTGGLGMPMPRQAVTYDKVPLGEVEVRRGDRVDATDGRIGRVQGLVIDPSDHHVTHFLLDEGHLWGEKEVAIPISAVSGVDDDGIHLTLTKEEIRDLPAVEVARE